MKADVFGMSVNNNIRNGCAAEKQQTDAFLSLYGTFADVGRQTDEFQQQKLGQEP